MSLLLLAAGACSSNSHKQPPATTIPPAAQIAATAPARLDTRTTPTPPVAGAVLITATGTVAAADPGATATPATATAATATSPTAAAAAAVPVTARDYAFDLPSTLPAGQTRFVVTNTGAFGHEMIVVRRGTMTPEEFRTAFMVPAGKVPAYAAVKTMGAIRPETTGEITVNLAPGNYGLLCFLPDPATGALHTTLGMVQSFTVQ